MLHFITQIIDVIPFQVTCRFNNGELRRIDLTPILIRYDSNPVGPIARLLDEDYFKTVQLDSYGTLSWDNEVEFCPDVLYGLSQAA